MPDLVGLTPQEGIQKRLAAAAEYVSTTPLVDSISEFVDAIEREDSRKRVLRDSKYSDSYRLEQLKAAAAEAQQRVEAVLQEAHDAADLIVARAEELAAPTKPGQDNPVLFEVMLGNARSDAALEIDNAPDTALIPALERMAQDEDAALAWLVTSTTWPMRYLRNVGHPRAADAWESRRAAFLDRFRTPGAQRVAAAMPVIRQLLHVPRLMEAVLTNRWDRGSSYTHPNPETVRREGPTTTTAMHVEATTDGTGFKFRPKD